jgi:hypothetical protein
MLKYEFGKYEDLALKAIEVSSLSFQTMSFEG